MNQHASFAQVFLIAFLSALCLFIGGGTLISTVAPAAYIKLFSQVAEYHPLLPLAEARTESFANVDEILPRQPYPKLTEISPAPKLILADTVGWINIPAIEVSAPIALSPTVDDVDVVSTLQHGTALYPNGIKPGQPGNVFIAAHSTGEPWRGAYRFAFLRLNELEVGHEISLDYKSARYTYKVSAKEIIHPDPAFRVPSKGASPTLTLMACWPLWTSNQRILVTADLTNITQLTLPPTSGT